MIGEKQEIITPVKETNPEFAGKIRWNFDKFLVDKKWTIINRFNPKTQPQNPELIKAIETALK